MVAEKVQIVKSIDHEFALIQLRSDGIVKVVFKDNFVLDIESQEKLFSLYNELCDGKKYPFLILAMKDVVITKEARENAIKLESESLHNSSAVIANSLPYKMMANFYLKFNKPKKPFKVFTKEEEAIQWLYQFRE